MGRWDGSVECKEGEVVGGSELCLFCRGKGEVGDVVGTTQCSVSDTQGGTGTEDEKGRVREREWGLSEEKRGRGRGRESWSSDNRAVSVTRLPQTHRKSSFPIEQRTHRMVQPGHIEPAD